MNILKSTDEIFIIDDVKRQENSGTAFSKHLSSRPSKPKHSRMNSVATNVFHSEFSVKVNVNFINI